MTLSWIALSFSLLGTAFGQLFFKMYFDRRNLVYMVAALGSFVLVPLFSYLALRNLDLSLVYMSTAATQVLALALARYVLHEPVTRTHVAASLLIVSGVVIYAS